MGVSFGMPKITIAFCKIRYSFVDKIISWWTGSIYTHVELVMPGGDWLSLRHGTGWLKRKYSLKIIAIPRDGINHEKWDTIELNVSDEQLSELWSFYKRTQGSKYDWIGMIASHLFGVKIKREKMWYCSEWVMKALIVSGVLCWRSTLDYESLSVSPGQLYNILQRKIND